MNVSEYEKQGLLIIGDALERYFGEQNIDDKSFKINLVNNAKKIGKNGLSILGDMGAYHHRSKNEELIDYELSLPRKYEDGIALKGFCLYHQKDFEKFSDEHKQKL
jgi:effector-binding domain-containing protein